MASTIHNPAQSYWSAEDQNLQERASTAKDNEHYRLLNYQHPSSIITAIEREAAEEEEEDEDMMMMEEEGSSSMSSSPSIPDENINFDLVYALHTFTATVEGQASVVKGDALILMEDTNIYWWLVEVLKTREIGYIPAENIETPYERLARLNKHRNVEITSPSSDTTVTTLVSSEFTALTSSSSKKVTIAGADSLETINFYEVESDIDLDDNLSTNEDDFQDADQNVTIENHSDSGYMTQVNGDDDIITPASQQPQQAQKPLPQSYLKPTMYPGTTTAAATTTTAAAAATSIASSSNKGASRIATGDISNTAPSPSGWKRDTSSLSLSSDSSKSHQHHSLETHSLRVFAGNIGQGPLFHSFDILATTTTDELLKEVVKRFNIVDTTVDDQDSTIEYYIAVQGADGDDSILTPQDKPLSIFKTLTASLTTPMPAVSQNVCRKPQEVNGTSRRKRSSSFGNYEQTSYEEDSVIRFYVHRRIKRAHERQGLVYIKVSLYPDDPSSDPYDHSLQHTHQTAQPPNSNSNNSNSCGSTASTFFFKNKKKKISAAVIKTEIDRIDKILPVSYDSTVSMVINMALEKFHVPDAEAEGMVMDQKAHPLDSLAQQHPNRRMTKYAMSVRSGQGQETRLYATDIMANVLHDHKQQTSEHISSDLLFILRQCDSPGWKSKNQLPPPPPLNTGTHKQDRKGSSSSVGSIANNAEDRRPSILDILMDSPPRSADERRPSYKSSPLASPRRFVGGDRRRSSHSTLQPHQQERNGSLVPSISDSISSSVHGLTPPNPAFSRSRQSSCSLISSSDQSDIIDPQHHLSSSSHDDISNTYTSNEYKKRKEGSSFKQQLKRLVGWGSSSASKQKKAHDLTISTSPSMQSATSTHQLQSQQPSQQQQQKQAQQQQQQHQQAPTCHSAFVSTGSNFSFSKAEGMQSNISTTSAPAMSTSLPPPPSSLYNNNNNSSHSVLPSTTPPASSTVSSPSGQWQHVDSVMMVHDASYANLSGTPTTEMSENHSLTPPPLVPPKTCNDSQISGVSTTSHDSGVVSKSSLLDVPQTVNAKRLMHGDDDDMTTSSSNSSSEDDEENCQENTATDVNYDDGEEDAGDDTDESDESDDPDCPDQRQRHCILATDKFDTVSDNQETKLMPNASLQGQQQQQQQQHQQQQQTVQSPADDFDSDLFFLVTQGVDYLKTRECTKWEDEENGYQYHPWNRPQPGNVAAEKKSNETGTAATKPTATCETHHVEDKQGDEIDPSVIVAATVAAAEGYSTPTTSSSSSSASSSSSSATIDKAMVSPPLSPSPDNNKAMKKSGSKLNEKVTGSTSTTFSSSMMTPKETPVDDEELKWIVNSHILF